MKTKTPAKFFLLALFLISFFLISVWFRKGLLLGGGEAGVPFYDPGRSQRLTFFAWSQVTIGKAPVTGSISVLFDWPAQILISLGLSQVAVQGLYFFFLLLTEGLGVLFLTKEIFREGKTSSLISLVAALFYMLNSMSLMGVWHRFQYPFMCFYTLMPSALFLFVRGFRLREPAYALILNIVCLIFSMAFASFPLLELFWLVIGSYLFFYVLTNWQNKQAVSFALKFFFLSFFLWLFLNLWWLFPFINALFGTKFVTTQAVTQVDDIWTFKTVSERLGRFLYLFRFHHKNFFENMAEVWGPIYFSPLFLILGFLAPIFAFGSLLVKKKPKLYWYFAFLSILGLFFTKGSAPPLGQIFLFAFSHFRPLEGFRNPFEKIGLILPLGFAPLFALGLTSFYSWLKKFNFKLAILSLSAICFLIFGIYSFPMWNGWVFTSSGFPASNLEIGDYVKVPEYYEEANQWLNENKSDFRAIALPIGGEGITYRWEYGYSGIELSHTLFDKPFISLDTAIPYLSEIVSPLEDFFLENIEKFYKLMGILNSKYLMVRSDIDYKIENMRSPEVIRERLEGIVGGGWWVVGGGKTLEFVKKFGELEFWKVPDELFVPHFYVANATSFVDKNLQNPYTPLSFDEFKLKEVVFSPQEENNLPLDLADNIYISAQPHPKEKIQITQLGEGKYLPGSKLYPFVRWKEDRLEKQITTAGDLEKIIDLNLGLANKRLGEIEALTGRKEKREKGKEKREKGDEELIEQTWERFWERLNKSFGLLKEVKSQGKDISEVAVRILEYVKLFQGRFIYFLRDEELQAGIPSKLKNLLVIRQRLEEQAWVAHDELEKRYLIEVPKAGSHELFIKELTSLGEDAENADVTTENPSTGLRAGADEFVGGLFKEDPFRPLTFAIDGKVATVSGQERDDNWLSFGKYELGEGKHKLQVFLPRFVNLAQQEDFALSAKKGESFILPLDELLEKGRDFNISFDYKIEGESLPRIIVAQKITMGEKEYVTRVVDTILPKSEYKLQFIKSFSVDSTAKQVGVKLFFEEYGDSKLYVENFQVTRDWRPEIVLRSQIDRNSSRKNIGTEIGKLGNWEIPKVAFRRVNPTRYEVWVDEAEEPYLLMFSESHHPGWKVYVDSKINGLTDYLLTDSQKDGVIASYFDGEIKELEHRNDFVYRGMFETWGKKSIPEDRHLLVNGYANSWFIKPEDVGGRENYKLIIEFQPQRLFYIGLLISGVTLVGCGGYLLVIKRLTD